jgi:hypothetical protein
MIVIVVGGTLALALCGAAMVVCLRGAVSLERRGSEPTQLATPFSIHILSLIFYTE